MPNAETTRCLIAGTGYVGLRAAEFWQQQRLHVYAITRSADKAARFREKGLHPIGMDLANPTPADRLPDADTVLWAVGFDRTTGASREQIWIDGLRWLVTNLPSAPRRLIYISSTSVYGADDGETVDESTPVKPSTEGGQCCVQAEEMLRALCAARFPATQVIVLRMAGIYGPDRLLRRIDDLQAEVPLPGAPDSWLNLIHVEDAVRMIDHAATHRDIPAVINVVNSGTLTRREYYTHLAQLAGTPPPTFSTDAATTRSRGGNKCVTSLYCNTPSAIEFRFNDVRLGLEQAYHHSEAK